jgi:hypothetical protein
MNFYTFCMLDYSEYLPYFWYVLLRIKLSTRRRLENEEANVKLPFFVTSTKSLMICHLKRICRLYFYRKHKTVGDCKKWRIIFRLQKLYRLWNYIIFELRYFCWFVYCIMEYILSFTSCPQFCSPLIGSLNLGK